MDCCVCKAIMFENSCRRNGYTLNKESKKCSRSRPNWPLCLVAQSKWPLLKATSRCSTSEWSSSSCHTCLVHSHSFSNARKLGPYFPARAHFPQFLLKSKLQNLNLNGSIKSGAFLRYPVPNLMLFHKL